ncbi:proline dehydrogenase family protein [Flexivirga caeni]|uniref:Proline dehydrogenase n=1 Tax=Flexivirga caeni TaxID=2294115 RepID=A0A3M9MI55_9MICO|nr:proline dehydrogenase family protein [Flexivirga caeni]RNI25174.1 proline dehydrogenase [Flexivirga caeni]
MIDPSATLRQGLLGIGRRGVVRRTFERAQVGRSVAHRFVAGDTIADCVPVVAERVGAGRFATVTLLADEPQDTAEAVRIRDTHLTALRALTEAGLTAGGRTDVLLRLEDLGWALGDDGPKFAFDSALQIAAAAAGTGATITLEAGDHTTADATLAAARDLRADFPSVGVGLHAQLLRTEADCRNQAASAGRVRLSRIGYFEPKSVSWQGNHQIDRSYIRCLKLLIESPAHPVIATDDLQLIEIAHALADKELRTPDSFEFELPLGGDPEVQRRHIEAGHRLRILVPYGDQWYPYVMRRVAEHPAAARPHARPETPKG